MIVGSVVLGAVLHVLPTPQGAYSSNFGVADPKFEDVDQLGVVVLTFLQHHLEGKLQRGRVAVVDVADHSVSLVYDLVHDTRDVHCSAPVNNTRSASFGGTSRPSYIAIIGQA
uniref:Secreted protein n=1 Tax=Timema genevievae TaxID=629358 RepID=A0A7R9PIF6_TIMGE|nr:unnamed protein product [Timema genevievae]